jgi:histidyl-tRNA synthetase
MAEKRKFQAIKGTRDLLPPETELWNRVEQTAREVFGTFGFGEIRPPILDETELFARSIGTETDVVSKEMYSLHEAPAVFEAIETVSLLETFGKEIDTYALVILYFKYCEEAVLELKAGSVPRTAENAKLLSDFELKKDQIQNALYSESTNPTSDQLDQFGSFLRAVLRGIELNKERTLRPEATASVCRAYIEHGLHALAQPVKLYYYGPMFRRERPQKGRYRQFYQIGAEVLEALQPGQQDSTKSTGKDAAVDAEVIEMVMAFFAKLELEGVQLEINSIGCRECRPRYVEALRTKLLEVKDKLGADSQRRIDTNPLRVLDSKLESEQGIIATLPRIADYLCDTCAKQYAELQRQLVVREVPYKENWRLVRGLDYYMRTTFEITALGLGSQNAVCGGGRYDGLVEILGGLPTKGIGFAIGEDRLILSLLEAGKGGTPQGRDVYVAWMGEKAQDPAIRAARTLRQAGFRVELPTVEQKFGKALGQADKIGAKYALILGDDEIASGQWTLKTLGDGSQKKMTEPQLLEFLRAAKK